MSSTWMFPERPSSGALAAADPRSAMLLDTLALAVPLQIRELARLTHDQRAETAERCAQVVAEHGDDLMFGSRRKGETAHVFNALATGLALAAYQPGGVTFAGQHWCTDHARCERAAAGLPDEPHPAAACGDCGDGYGSTPPRRPVETVTPTGGLL